MFTLNCFIKSCGICCVICFFLLNNYKCECIIFALLELFLFLMKNQMWIEIQNVFSAARFHIGHLRQLLFCSVLVIKDC